MRWLYYTERTTDGKWWAFCQIEGRKGGGSSPQFYRSEWRAIKEARKDYLKRYPLTVAEAIKWA